MEGAAQGRQSLGICRIAAQGLQRLPARLHHGLGFFQEDLQQLLVQRFLGFQHGGSLGRRHQNLQIGRQHGRGLGRWGGAGIEQRCRNGGRKVDGVVFGLFRLLRHHCRRLGYRRRRHITGTLGAHHDAQLAAGRIKDKELARQGTLVAQHVEQKAQRAQAVAQLFKHHGFVVVGHLAGGQLVYHRAQMLGGCHGLVQAQHRQHAAHLRQRAGDRAQHRDIVGVAEILVQVLFRFGQGGMEFIDHTAHGLVVADAAVQLFDPGLQRLRRLVGQHMVQALRQAVSALAHQRGFDVQRLQIGLQVQHGGGHFHGQRRRRWRARSDQALGHAAQRRAQLVGTDMELVQRFADQVELVGHGLDLVAVAIGQRRPQLGS